MCDPSGSLGCAGWRHGDPQPLPAEAPRAELARAALAREVHEHQHVEDHERGVPEPAGGGAQMGENEHISDPRSVEIRSRDEFERIV